jgi:hypothetical protein
MNSKHAVINALNYRLYSHIFALCVKNTATYFVTVNKQATVLTRLEKVVHAVAYLFRQSDSSTIAIA